MIKAIIFDMDGVLIDAREWHYETLNQALHLFGYEITRYEHLTTFDGLPTSKKLQLLSINKGIPKGLHAFINEMKQQFTLQTVHRACKPTFQHQYALSRLKQAGYLLGLASNSVKNTVTLMMEKAGLARWLDLQLSCEEVSKPKPAPDIYLTAARKLNVAPEACLVIEDNHHGVASAKAAGTHVMQVSSPKEVTLENIQKNLTAISQQEREWV